MKLVAPAKTIPSSLQTRRLLHFLKQNQKILCITGAGISTESGVPDYRGAYGAYSLGHRPITYQQFANSNDSSWRQRYWFRSVLGFSRHTAKKPNQGHVALQALIDRGLIDSIITQNVDGLHHQVARKDSQKILELHGRLSTVKCQLCRDSFCRHEFQKVAMNENKWLSSESFLNALKKCQSDTSNLRPDGDVDVTKLENYEQLIQQFRVPQCVSLGCRRSEHHSSPAALLKPDFVFFGENMEREVAERARDMAADSDACLVLGTTCSTASVTRLLKKMRDDGKPLAVVNVGETTIDNFDNVAVRLHTTIGATLSTLVQQLDNNDNNYNNNNNTENKATTNDFSNSIY